MDPVYSELLFGAFLNHLLQYKRQHFFITTIQTGHSWEIVWFFNKPCKYFAGNKGKSPRGDLVCTAQGEKLLLVCDFRWFWAWRMWNAHETSEVGSNGHQREKISLASTCSPELILILMISCAHSSQGGLGEKEREHCQIAEGKSTAQSTSILL